MEACQIRRSPQSAAMKPTAPPDAPSISAGARRPRWQRVLAWLALGTGLLVLALIGVGFVLDEPRPHVAPSAEADVVAHAVERAVNVAAWERTGAVRWTFAGQRSHLWDRARSLVRVRWGSVEVQLRGTWGRAWRDGVEVRGAERNSLVAQAWSGFVNDSFWLNPCAKLFDPGTQRALIALPGGGRGLLVSYASGGVTPGDAYLWELPPAGRGDTPRAWKMWVSIIPIGGVEASWERFITLATGARVATRHRLGPVTLRLDDVAGAATLAELEPGADPFAKLLAPR